MYQIRYNSPTWGDSLYENHGDVEKANESMKQAVARARRYDAKLASSFYVKKRGK